MAIEKTTEYMDGWAAHKNDCVSGENPYDERKQSYSFGRWLSGWCGRFDAVKHGKSLELDEVYD
jgi:hypothetical protein